MKYFTAFLASCSLLAALAFAPPAIAADRDTSYCPHETSLFGNVISVTPKFFDVQSVGGDEGKVRIYGNGARLHDNGLSVRPGVFVGAYGCYDHHDYFRASELTLSTNANTYNGYRRYVTTITGVVTSLQGNRVLVQTNGRSGKVWVYNNTAPLQVGERVAFRGSFDPANSAFVATSTVVNP